MKGKILNKKLKKLSLEILIRIFYAYDISRKDIKELLSEFIEGVRLPKEYLDLIYQITKFYEDNREAVDKTIQEHLQDWRFERLGFIERAVLRIGVSKILMAKASNYVDIKDFNYTISFLLELLECYTDSKKAVKFVNGILGAIERENLAVV
ncbi:MAG: transcription antitermination factor NusB [Hydrogenothermaceae bacterium]